jgi:hypothetical protein
MFHANTEFLLAYWRRQRRERALPARSDIDPAGFFPLAPHVFICLREGAGALRFGLAGEGVIDLHGRPLRGEDLLTFWRPSDRPLLVKVLETALSAADPAVVTALAAIDREATVRLEVLFAPLTGPDGAADRFLGLCQPLSPFPLWRERPALDLAIRMINGVEPPASARSLRLAVLNGRRIA